MSYLVGLTGGIGSGKSTVAILFKECGVTVVDSDDISHQLTRAGGEAIAAIRAEFGEEYIEDDGALDRSRMRRLVFSDPDARKHLEAVLHPMIRGKLLEQVRANSTSSPYMLLIIPLLFEANNYRDLVHRVVAVDCDEETQLARTMRRSGMIEQEVRAIMAGQIARAERLKLADDIIRNDSDMDSLRLQVSRLHRKYLDISAGSD
ncbi:MAG: dephospho-CoA kinase [Gallionellaceae bacterium]